MSKTKAPQPLVLEPVIDDPAITKPRPRRKARLEIPAIRPRPTRRANAPSVPTMPAAHKPIARAGTVSVTRPSALEAAAQILRGLSGRAATEGLSAGELIERMAAANLWISPGSKTPAATLFAAMTREIAAKGPASRFRKAGPGRFASNSSQQAKIATSRVSAKHEAAKTPERGR